MSPHPDAFSKCELCHSQFKIIEKNPGVDHCGRLKFAFFVIFDLLFFAAVVLLLWMAFGWVTDSAFNNLLEEGVGCGPYAKSPNRLYKNLTTPCSSFRFTGQALFEGRIWFWGFVSFFFSLGVLGCCCYCCCKGEGSSTYDYSNDSNDCWWVCCGPSYYNGYYYSSPWGYWSGNDICCWWMMWDLSTPHYYHHHHHSSSACCDCGSGSGSCGNLCSGGSSDCNCCSGGGGDKDGLSIIAVILLVIVVIFVVCGVIFGAIIAFMVFNKIIKRHLHLVQRKHMADNLMVADLDDPTQVSSAEMTVAIDAPVESDIQQSQSLLKSGKGSVYIV